MFTLGTDMEVFARDKNGKAIALCGLIGGTKREPKQIKSLSKGFCVQEDNVALEFNIPPASECEEFSQYVGIMSQEVNVLLDKLGLHTVNEASISFDDDQLEHPQAKVFGCEPDYNAWTKMENEMPMVDDVNLRTAGGHVHVGTNNVDMITGVRLLDLFLGVPSVLLDCSEESIKRRLRYGKAGAMRPKPYGFEYRTLSNFWMFSDVLVKWVFNNSYTAVRRSESVKITIIEAQHIQECINTGNKELARQLIKKYNVPFPEEHKGLLNAE